MLTYNLNETGKPLYQSLYECIRKDILLGKLTNGYKMPSKRSLAKNLGVSTITVESAYEQLISEGYIYSVARKGYFISDISPLPLLKSDTAPVKPLRKEPAKHDKIYDFSSGASDKNDFPYSVWSRLMRDAIAGNKLLLISPCEGIAELRSAISEHLSSFRGMNVDPDQIIIGAGTEYLYTLLIKLLGSKHIYAIENPGYKKLALIYSSSGVKCCYTDMDENGIRIDKLEKSGATIAHVSPTHHFPTGITMPVSRRYELLSWANKRRERYIIEDDYDSEFRLNGKPIPALRSIDAKGKVIYMNTFSKSLASSIRISYMVLPEGLAKRFFKKLSFYSNTVSTFDQYVLSSFISMGYFEKHINRMRLKYGRKRTLILEEIRSVFKPGQYRIIENDSGLHFLIEFNMNMSDKEFREKLLKKGIRISSISDYYMDGKNHSRHRFMINYSALDTDGLRNALSIIKDVLENDE